MKMCFNKNVLVGLGVVAAAVFLIEPKWFAAVLPVLVLAACPLSMLLMMRGMGRSSSRHALGDEREESEQHLDPARSADEVARLRAEVADLRAVLQEKKPASPSADTSSRS